MGDDDKTYVADAAAEADVGASHHSAVVDDMALEEEADDDIAWAYQIHQDAPRDS